MDKFVRDCKKFFKRLRIHHYIAFAVVLGIGIFNAVTALSPMMSQKELESNIEKSFEKWWTEEGAAQFRTVGLTDDEKTKMQEFVQYRDRILSAGKTFDIDERKKAMRTEFREWWEIGGGKEQYTREHGKYPTEKEFERECYKYIKNYTDKFLRYNMAYVPKDGEIERLTTSWLLFPSLASYLLFALLFLFAYVIMCERWGVPITAGFFLLLAVGGGLVVGVFTETSFFSHAYVERYMGASIALAFMLGATAFDHNKDDVSTVVRGIAVMGMLLDAIVNMFVNTGIFTATAIASIPMFGLGALAGIKMPKRRKSFSELRKDALEHRMKQTAQRNITAERRAKTRSQMDTGFSEAQKGHYDAAKVNLCQAMTGMLQEQPLDAEGLTKLAERMVSPNLFIDVPSTQWLEWGDTARSRMCYEAALELLEKGLKLEKDAKIARRALFTIGEIRVNRGIEPEEGIKRLQKVVEMNAEDLLAKQAKRMLEKAGV